MGRKALVTGASGGIGSATARRLALDGWEVVVHYHTHEDRAKALSDELGARMVRADVRQPDEVEAMFRQIGHIDLLVCCAGVAEYGLLTDATEPIWHNIIATNTDGVYRCCRAAIPGMVHEKSGCIILTSSVWGVHGASCEVPYSASKAALIGLTMALAKELGPSGIRVNAVAPGAILTDMLTQYDFIDLDSIADRTPLGRIGRPEDVAELIAFLASDRASFITGQTIGCDGGFGA